MIQISEAMGYALASRSFRMICRATITRGGAVLARDLPVDIGREEGDRSLRVPERVTLQIPKRINGQEWTGDGYDSPIAPYGQRVHVKIGIDLGADGFGWINRGEFLIHDSDLTGPTVTINAVGLLALHEEARLVSPFKPTGTVVSCIRKLAEPGLTVVKHADVVDHAVNTGLAFDDDRLGCILTLCQSISARPLVNPAGYLDILPGDQPNPESIFYQDGSYLMRLHDPTWTYQRPSIVDVSTSATRDGIINAMVVRGETSTGLPVQGVAYDQSGGPGSFGGPFNPMPVPEYLYSSIVPTKALATLVARTMLNRRLAPYRRSWHIRSVPIPFYQVGDYAYYYYTQGDEEYALTEVESMVLPYTAASGQMELTVRELAP
jgi:hypothetical protein